ncbi:hypothetical protein IFR05_007999 [Cadophora sp. M221]|nr:hypothetical protein IFR05_007999 [Cadophora sp. M221]
MSNQTDISIELQTSTQPSSPPSTNGGSSIRSSIPSLPPEPPLTPEEIEKKPWKYIGYRGYSDFIASENDFYIVRRFAALNTRAALALQDKVSVLEEQLEDLDRTYSRRDTVDVHNGSFRDDQEERSELMSEIIEALTKYTDGMTGLDAFILQQAELKKLPQAARQDLESVQNWHFNHGGQAIAPEEQQYLTHSLDVFSVVPREKTPLRRLLDRSRTFRISSLWKSDEAPSLPLYDQDVITYTSDKRIDRFVTVLIVGIGTVMLLAPMWILQALDRSVLKLAVITVFVVVFLGLVSYATVAKPFETLAATAAYSAVLMVFLQLGSSTGGNV